MFSHLLKIAAHRRGDVGRRKRRRGHLIKQRLEEMIIGAVDDRELHFLAASFLAASSPPKPAPTITTRGNFSSAMATILRDWTCSQQFYLPPVLRPTCGSSSLSQIYQVEQIEVVTHSTAAIFRALCRSQSLAARPAKPSRNDLKSPLRARSSLARVHASSHVRQKREAKTPTGKMGRVHKTDVARIKANLPFGIISVIGINRSGLQRH